ncbi:TetR family transcriptional regulator [Nocardia sp. NBC_01329]|uniref:TetR family transcriptional regulator n=1 Tax=Nocardia sp. NBC_01329 TaxID=2903594 RepID=UPI002E0D8AC6|nr:TetR/AcrR family transcriptional regulator [Nocardia sp. NBC_01329]
MGETTGLRDRKRAETRAAIIRAATDLFLDRGFTATSATDIATAAGVSRRTFFLYFPAKEDVLFHHLEAHIRSAVDTLDGLDPGATPWDSVQAAALALVDAFDTATDRSDELADVRADVVRGARGIPGSLMLRLQSAHTELLGSLRERFPGPELRPVLATHLGACLGAAVAAAVSTTPAERATAMRAAIRRAGAGFGE